MGCRRALWVFGAAALTLLSRPAGAFAQGESPPAGGAAIGEVILATAVGLVGTALVLGPVLLYRAGKLPRSAGSPTRSAASSACPAGRRSRSRSRAAR